MNRVSPHGPVSIRQASLAVLIEPVGRRLLPCTPWRNCRSIRPKALRDLHEGGHDLAVLHELRVATDLVLQATKMTAQSLGRAMSTLVVQELHLWLCLTDMKEQEKLQFLNAPMSQTGLFGDTVESCAQQFSAAQKQTEAIKTSCTGRNLLLPLRLQPLSLLIAVGAPLRPPSRCSSSLPPGGVVEPVTGRTPSPSRPPPNPAASVSARGPETGDPEMEGTAHREMVTAPLPPPEEGRVENLLFNFVFVPPLAQQPAVPKTSIKEQFPQSLGLKRRRVVYRASRDHFPPLSPGSEWVVAQEHPSCPFVEPGKGSSTQVPTSSRHTPGCHKPQAGLSCVSTLTRRNQVSVTLPRPRPLPSQAPGRVPVFHIAAPPRVRRLPVGAAGTVSRSLASAPQSVSVAPTGHQTRLCDSVRPASPQVQGHPLHFSQGRRCSCLACRNRSPAGEGCDRAGPSSQRVTYVTETFSFLTRIHPSHHLLFISGLKRKRFEKEKDLKKENL